MLAQARQKGLDAALLVLGGRDLPEMNQEVGWAQPGRFPAHVSLLLVQAQVPDSNQAHRHPKALAPQQARLTVWKCREGRLTPDARVTVTRCCPSGGVCLEMARTSDSGTGCTCKRGSAE